MCDLEAKPTFLFVLGSLHWKLIRMKSTWRGSSLLMWLMSLLLETWKLLDLLKFLKRFHSLIFSSSSVPPTKSVSSASWMSDPSSAPLPKFIVYLFPVKVLFSISYQSVDFPFYSTFGDNFAELLESGSYEQIVFSSEREARKKVFLVFVGKSTWRVNFPERCRGSWLSTASGINLTLKINKALGTAGVSSTVGSWGAGNTKVQTSLTEKKGALLLKWRHSRGS